MHKDDLYLCYLANYVECGASLRFWSAVFLIRQLVWGVYVQSLNYLVISVILKYLKKRGRLGVKVNQ